MYLSSFHIGTQLFGTLISSPRYQTESSIYDIIMYPYAIVDYLRIVIDGGIFSTFSWFVFGYWLGVIGFIENLESKITKKVVAISWLLYVIFLLLPHFFQGGIIMKFACNLFATFSYALTVIYVYYKSEICQKCLSKLEAYGKLGLTNYSLQGILGVIIVSEFALYRFPLSIVLVIFIFFYVCQAVFSYYWLSKFKYGPMEMYGELPLNVGSSI